MAPGPLQMRSSKIPTQLSTSSQMPSASASAAQSSAHAKDVELVPVAVAVAGWDVRAATFVNGSWAIANAVVQCSDAVVYVVTDAIYVRIGSAVTSARQGRRVGSRRSRSRRLGCPRSHIRKWLLGHCKCRSRPMFRRSCLRRHRCHLRPHRQRSPPHTPRTSSWFPSQSQSPAGMFEHPQAKLHQDHHTFVQIGACAVVEVRIGIVVARSRISAPKDKQLVKSHEPSSWVA